MTSDCRSDAGLRHEIVGRVLTHDPATEAVLEPRGVGRCLEPFHELLGRRRLQAGILFGVGECRGQLGGVRVHEVLLPGLHDPPEHLELRVGRHVLARC